SLYVRSVTLLAGERAALCSDWGLALHDTTTGKELFYFRPGTIGTDLAPSPDGRHFVTSGPVLSVYPIDRRERLLALHVRGAQWLGWGPGGIPPSSWTAALPVGEFIDRGPARLAEYVPLNRLKDRHRPDLLRRVLPLAR